MWISFPPENRNTLSRKTPYGENVISHVFWDRISLSHVTLSKDLRLRPIPTHQSVAWSKIGRLPEFRIVICDQCDGLLTRTST